MSSATEFRSLKMDRRPKADPTCHDCSGMPPAFSSLAEFTNRSSSPLNHFAKTGRCETNWDPQLLYIMATLRIWCERRTKPDEICSFWSWPWKNGRMNRICSSIMLSNFHVRDESTKPSNKHSGQLKP